MKAKRQECRALLSFSCKNHSPASGQTIHVLEEDYFGLLKAGYIEPVGDSIFEQKEVAKPEKKTTKKKTAPKTKKSVKTEETPNWMNK
jgi:hypothetical protein